MTFRSILRSYDTGVRDIALVFDVPHRYGRENLLRTTIPRFCINKRIVDRGYSLITCCEVTTRSTKVGYLMYLGNSNDVLLVLILSCCEDESMLLA
jgi:hypothetical protein